MSLIRSSRISKSSFGQVKRAVVGSLFERQHSDSAPKVNPHVILTNAFRGEFLSFCTILLNLLLPSTRVIQVKNMSFVTTLVLL